MKSSPGPSGRFVLHTTGIAAAIATIIAISPLAGCRDTPGAPCGPALPSRNENRVTIPGRYNLYVRRESAEPGGPAIEAISPIPLDFGLPASSPESKVQRNAESGCCRELGASVWRTCRRGHLPASRSERATLASGRAACRKAQRADAPARLPASAQRPC